MGGKKRKKPLETNGFSRKKVLSLVLCVAVMLSVMVLGAGAAFSDQDQIENTEAVDACSALNIIGGYEDGSFHPERNIKRSEITKMICVALNGGKDPNVGTNETPTFTDVRGTADAWAEGYIEACVAQGIVSGVGGGRFAPAGNVTGAQLAKMLLVALGYNSDNEGFTGNAWETNVNVRAAQKHLYDGLEKMDTSAAVTRDQAAQMVWNAMQAYEVEYKTTIITDENGQLITQVKVEDKLDANFNRITLLYDKYEAYVNVGTLTSIDGSNLVISMNSADEADSDTKHTEFTKVAVNYSELMGQKVKVMFTKTSEVLGVFATDANTTYTVNMKDIEKDGDKVKFDGASYGFDNGSNIDVVKLDATNEKVVTGTTMSAAEFDAKDTDLASVKFVDNDGDGKLNIAIITEYLAKEVTYVGSDRITAGETYKMADENIAEDLAKDDYAMISYNMYDECLDIVKAEVVTDTLNSSRDKDTYRQYEIASTWYNIEKVASTGYDKVTLGDTVKAHIVAGVIVSIDTDDGTGAVPMNIAVVVGNADSTTTVYGDQVKLRFFDGTTKIVTTDSNGVHGTDTELGQVYKLSGPDSNTKLEKLKNQKYNGYEFISDLDKVYGGSATGEAITDKDNKNTASTKLDMIAGKKVDDNAVIILFDDAGNSKKITGKQFKSIVSNDSKLGSTNDAAWSAFTKEVNGLTRVMLASVNVKDINVSGVSYDNYGYVTVAGKDKANGDVEFRMWDGTENRDVKVEKDSADNYAKGTLVAYSSIDENGYLKDVVSFGTIKSIAKYDGANQDPDVAKANIAAGSNLADSAKSISIGDNSLNVTADTHVLMVNSDLDDADDIGQTYKYGETKLATAAKDESGNYKYNVVYRVESGDPVDNGVDLDLVVVDVTGAFDFNKPESSNPGGGDQGSSVTDGDFIYKTENASLLKVASARTDENGSLTFNLEVVNAGVKTDNLTYTWTVFVDGVKINSATVNADGAAGGKDDYADVVTVEKVYPKDGEKITISLTDIKAPVMVDGATADQINNALTQENAKVTVTKVPAGEITVPENAKLTLSDGADITGDTVIKGEGSVEVGKITVSGDADLSNVQPNIAAGKTVTVSKGATLKIDAHTDGNLPSGTGTLEVASGGTLKSVGTSEENEGQEVTFVGTDDNARIKTEEGTSVKINLSDNGSHKMTITGDASIPAKQIWYTMFGSGKDKTKGIDTTLENGTLTVKGTLKLASGTTGTTFTVKNGANVVVDKGATVTVAAKATLIVNGTNAFVGTDATSKLSVTKKANSQTIDGIANVNHGSTKNYTWKQGSWEAQ